ncbi:uncharacterized protein LOC124938713 [Impatiens glandulifera]|uniref:uncharacterized protein LOC124938713 n=1 Tax=Impatiens glandulifera TaxID=253017 RepID=UPI001FB0B4A6|nr:uncharacterized protein LOC124938713 [Impatiens glandulifera]
MDLTIVIDTITSSATQGLGIAKFPRHSEQHSSSSGCLQVSAVIFPVDSMARPPVRSRNLKTIPRRQVSRRKRTRRSRSATDGGSDGSDGGGYFGGGGGGGGGGWNFDRFGWSNWDESSSSSPADPAFDFVYEVICWIVLSNCLHFSFKKVVRIVANGIGGSEREKVQLRLNPVY